MTLDPPPFQVATELAPEAVRVSAHGEVDIMTVPELRAALQAAEQHDVAAIVLDLSGVTFIDSTGVGVLVEAAQSAGADGNRLSILCSPAVDRVIELSGLKDRLPLA